MSIGIRDVGPEALKQYGEITIRFVVRSIFRVEEVDGGLGGLALREVVLDQPYTKDYGQSEGEGPLRWHGRFDLANWGFFLAYDGDRPVGAATVAFRSPEANMLEGRTDLAVLWDIRVRPDRRREGIGTRLFQRAVAWARERDCSQLKVETQNVNVGACRFYASQGCRLGAIHRHAYQDSRVAGEAMLLWYLDL